jgi:hypothetical protein
MKHWLSELIAFLIGKPKHPIYRRELAGWSYIGAWRRARRGCIPLIMVLFATTTCLCGGSCGLTLLPTSGQAPGDWPLILVAIGVGLAVGLAIGEGVLRFVTGLTATALNATVISSEIEAETFALLRLTMIPPREIVLAKFGAAVSQLRTPVAALILVRLVIAVVGLLFALGLLFFGMWESRSQLPVLPVAPGGGVTGALLAAWYGVAAATAVAAVVAWLLYYVLRPTLDMLMFAAIGMFASSWARTRANGLIAAGAFRLVLWMASYVAGQFVSTMISLLSLPLMSLPGIPVWIQEQAGGWGLMVIIVSIIAVLLLLAVIAVEVAIILAFLFLSTERAKCLPFLA